MKKNTSVPVSHSICVYFPKRMMVLCCQGDKTSHQWKDFCLFDDLKYTLIIISSLVLLLEVHPDEFSGDGNDIVFGLQST